MAKHDYRVTAKAGPRVNGERVVAGAFVRMTPQEARFYLDQLEVEPVEGAAGVPAAAKPKR